MWSPQRQVENILCMPSRVFRVFVDFRAGQYVSRCVLLSGCSPAVEFGQAAMIASKSKRSAYMLDVKRPTLFFYA